MGIRVDKREHSPPHLMHKAHSGIFLLQLSQETRTQEVNSTEIYQKKLQKPSIQIAGYKNIQHYYTCNSPKKHINLVFFIFSFCLAYLVYWLA